MKTVAAIKKFMGIQGYNPDMVYITPTVHEIKEFKDSCTAAEWNSFGKCACDLMGEEWEPAVPTK